MLTLSNDSVNAKLMKCNEIFELAVAIRHNLKAHHKG